MDQTPAATPGIANQPAEIARQTAQPKRDSHLLIASPWHTLLVLAIQGYLSYRGSMRAGHAHALAGMDRIVLYERTMVSEWMVLAVVLIGVWWHGSSVFTVLGERWRSPRQVLRDLGIGLLFLVVTIVFGSVLSHGIERSAARVILPQGKTEMWLWVALSLTAGICEEALYRGYFQRQFIAITRSVPAGILLSAVLFGAGHLYQGLPQALQIGVLGAMGGIVAYWCKSVRPGMIAHTVQDVLGGLIGH